MNYYEALKTIIDVGIEAVKTDYKDDLQKMEGSIAGFEACRNLEPSQLGNLLNSCHKATHNAYVSQTKDYWFIKCYEAEVDWVCNVISAILYNQGMEVIVQPTARGMLMASKVVGVKPKEGK